MRNIPLVLLGVMLTFACKSPQNETSQETGKYQELYRPQVHFTPDSMWMNDPNGMVYYEGEYHLFYQYYPDSTVWGPMHWGHAISTDLIHWEHLPIALYPDENGWIFSGSAVVDKDNTSGLGKDGKGPLVAIFTYHNSVKEYAGDNDFQTQGIAYSNDKGRTWTTYENNPVLNNPGIRDFRDPKVMWHEPSKNWIMTLAVQDHVVFYSSSNLLEWKKESEFGKENGAHTGVWECPDLFEMPIDGKTEKAWVLLLSINPGGPNGGSATQYFVGNFDGHKFIPETTDTLWLDYGRDNYAGVTWSNIPEKDGRRLFLGWMSNWDYATVVPTERWRSAMTLPRSLTLKEINGSRVLFSEPVKELELLHSEALKTETIRLNPEHPEHIEKLNSIPIEIRFEVEASEMQNFNDGEFYFGFKNEKGDTFQAGYNFMEHMYFSDRTDAGVNDFSEKFSSISKAIKKAPEKLSVQIIVDKSSIEIFYNQGETVFTELVFPRADYDTFYMGTEKISFKIDHLKFYSLNSIWHP